MIETRIKNNSKEISKDNQNKFSSFSGSNTVYKGSSKSSGTISFKDTFDIKIKNRYSSNQCIYKLVILMKNLI